MVKRAVEIQLYKIHCRNKNKFIFKYSATGLSIKCWECRSDSDPKCADPFDNSTLSITDCKQNAELEHLPGVKATMCRKIRQKGVQFCVRHTPVHTFSISCQFYYYSER